MMSCDLMSEYYRMCVAAGLNYYRKVPDITGLLKLSEWDTRTIIEIYDYYTQDKKTVSFKMDKQIVLKMIMKEKYGLNWDGEQWFDERENRMPLCDRFRDD